MGPLAGAMTGAVADLVGCLAYGYTINPIVTLGAAAVGLIAGTVGLLFSRSTLLLRVSLCTVPAHLVGSVLIKTAGLAAWYLASYEIGYVQLLLWRLLNYAIIAALESTLLYLLCKNPAIAKQLRRLNKNSFLL
jgi:ECF transporter S component (folate family)